MRFFVAGLCFFLGLGVSGAVSQSRLSSDEVQVLAQTAKQAAYAETLAGWCSQKNPKGASQYGAALKAWSGRNHWNALAAGPVKTELSPGEYDGLKTEATSALNAHSFKSVFLCARMAQVLAQPEHDPSVKYGQDLARMAPFPTPPGDGSAVQTTPQARPSAVASGSQPEVPAMKQAVVSPPASSTGGETPPVASPKAPAQSSAGAGGRVTVGDVSLELQPGWVIQKQAGDTALLEKMDKRAKLILALSLRPMQGTLQQAFPVAVRHDFPGQPPELKYIHQGKTRGGQEALTVRDGGRLNLPNHPNARLRAVGIAAPDGRMFLAMLLMRSDWESAMSNADNEFEAMITSLRFGPQPENTLWDFTRPPKGSGGQSGLYWANSLQNQLNPLGGMDLRAIRHYVILLPNGQAYNDLPEDGHVLDIDFATACKKRPKSCGTYVIQGNNIHFRWMGDYGLVDESDSAWGTGGEHGFTTRGGSYRHVNPVHDLRLNGRFTSTFAMVGNMVAQSTSVVSETYITLTSDGRYQKSGFSAASFDNSNAAGTFGGKKGVQSGTYTMNNYTLVLTPTGSAPESYSLVLEDPTPSSDALFINDSAFLRNKNGR